MATLLPDESVTRAQLQGYRVFIYSHDHPHPAHVHLGKRKRISDWDLASMQCVDPDGFSKSEIAEQRKLLRKHGDRIWRNWHAHWQAQGPPG